MKECHQCGGDPNVDCEVCSNSGFVEGKKMNFLSRIVVNTRTKTIEVFQRSKGGVETIKFEAPLKGQITVTNDTEFLIEADTSDLDH